MSFGETFSSDAFIPAALLCRTIANHASSSFGGLPFGLTSGFANFASFARLSILVLCDAAQDQLSLASDDCKSNFIFPVFLLALKGISMHWYSRGRTSNPTSSPSSLWVCIKLEEALSCFVWFALVQGCRWYWQIMDLVHLKFWRKVLMLLALKRYFYCWFLSDKTLIKPNANLHQTDCSETLLSTFKNSRFVFVIAAIGAAKSYRFCHQQLQFTLLQATITLFYQIPV